MDDCLEQAVTYFQPNECIIPCVDIGYMPLHNFRKDVITLDFKQIMSL